MNTLPNNNLQRFFTAGINYRKSDIVVRSKFSLTPDQCESLLQAAASKNIQGLLILSTCNRTELYGICNDPGQLIDLLCMYTHGTKQEFIEHGYIRNAVDAAEHLFKVAAGLDSQIIGDYEILSQLKLAAKVSKHHGRLNSFMEKLINYALQASKEIKTNTKLSSGTVSVSYAAVEIIQEKISEINGKKILLVGTGKFGNHLAQNLKKYFPGSQITLINRTDEKAFELAQLYDTKFLPYDNLSSAADEADILVVSSAAGDYIISPVFFSTKKSRLILDLSVPQNVDPAVQYIGETTLMNVDEISVILDKTISLREAEIPVAFQIIESTLSEMLEWYRKQSVNPVLRKVKSQLYELSGIPADEEQEQYIQKTVSSLAINLQQQDNKGCQCINALSSYLRMSYATTC